jgi:hypothetical protein
MASSLAIAVRFSPEVQPLVDELTEIARRRASLPEFRDRLLEIVEALPDAFETRWVDLENGPTLAGEVALYLEFRQPFLDRVAAIRAFDRNFNAV